MTASEPGKPSEQANPLLTSIHDAYTLSNTPEESDHGIDGDMIKAFLNTLAEVALAVASRKQGDLPR